MVPPDLITMVVKSRGEIKNWTNFCRSSDRRSGDGELSHQAYYTASTVVKISRGSLIRKTQLRCAFQQNLPNVTVTAMSSLMPVHTSLKPITSHSNHIDQSQTLPPGPNWKTHRRKTKMGNGVSWPTRLRGQLYEHQTHQYGGMERRQE